jgi:hypothetical protein
MSRRRSGSHASRGSYTPRELRQVIGGLLPHVGLPVLPAGLRQRWTARLLVTCAVLLAWQPAGSALADRFDAARAAVVAMYPGRRRPGRTYVGFIAALARVSAGLLAVVADALRRAVRQSAEAAGCWTVGGGGGGGGRCVFGVDGTKVDCPMTKANEEAFGLASRKNSWPQQLLTVLFHVGSGLPWAFARGGARDSERSHLLGMLDALPAGALLLADAGFTGYELLRAVMAGGGRSFVIRVGSNVRLLTRLGYAVREYEGIVYLWPAGQRKKACPPLVLRLVTVHDGRGRRVHLLTDVLDPRELGDAAVAELYRRRWGVELLFRALKQTLGRRKLLSDSPAHARVELDWSVVGLWVLELAHARSAGADARRGTAAALRAVRAAAAGRGGGGGSLRQSLAAAVRDGYARRGSKKARHWPHKKRDRPPGDPLARTATPEEVQLAQEIKQRKAAA